MKKNLINKLAQIMLLLATLNGCSRSADLHHKILGTWEAGGSGVSVTHIFSSDGTYRLVLPTGESRAGTWSIEGDKLTMTFRSGPDNEIVVFKILRLEDSILVYEAIDKSGKTAASSWTRTK
jgi:hypothetical protein